MVKFIAGMIEKSANISLEDGKELYRKYFINVKLYGKFRKKVDAELRKRKLDTVIVVE